jgi:hypothetical protein
MNIRIALEMITAMAASITNPILPASKQWDIMGEEVR